mgnify:FL=1
MFLMRLGPGKFAYLSYEIKGDRMYILSTYTPEEFRGRGIAAELTREALEYARREGLKVVPVCSYTKRFLEKNKEYSSLVVEG